MVTNPFVAANCPIQYGNWEGPADTARGITVDTTRLGNVYYTIGEGTGSKQSPTPRAIMIAKNSSGATLSRNLVVAHATANGSWPHTITGLGAALSGTVAGVVEDGYINGVPDGALFRLVIEGLHYCQYYTTSDAKVATVTGRPLVVAGSGEVFAWDTSVAAGAATFGQIDAVMGFSAYITANVTDNGIQRLIFVKTKFA